MTELTVTNSPWFLLWIFFKYIIMVHINNVQSCLSSPNVYPDATDILLFYSIQDIIYSHVTNWVCHIFVLASVNFCHRYRLHDVTHLEWHIRLERSGFALKQRRALGNCRRETLSAHLKMRR